MYNYNKALFSHKKAKTLRKNRKMKFLRLKVKLYIKETLVNRYLKEGDLLIRTMVHTWKMLSPS